MIDLTKENLIADEVDDVKRSVRRACFSDSKEAEIIEFLKKASWSVLKDEEFYKRRKQYKEKEGKIKKIVSRMLIMSGVLALGAMVESEHINFLPSWVLSVTMYFFAAIFIVLFLVDIYYKGEFY